MCHLVCSTEYSTDPLVVVDPVNPGVDGAAIRLIRVCTVHVTCVSVHTLAILYWV